MDIIERRVELHLRLVTFNAFVGLSLLRYVTEYGHKDAVSAVVSHSINGVRPL